ncbi:hypothetical protein ACEPWQ_10920 [Leclercia adecarboxylata]|uniref:hypothetical protein n=1 Tax=Leclercia adecarboxylata TaxID=83655 RepID=UPI0035902729
MLSGSLVVLAYSIPGGWLIFVVGHAVFIQLRDDFLLSGVLLLRLRLSEIWFCLIDGRLIHTILNDLAPAGSGSACFRSFAYCRWWPNIILVRAISGDVASASATSPILAIHYRGGAGGAA